MGKSDGRHIACRDTGQCNHKKHGYTKRDHAAPSLLPRTRPQHPEMKGWDHGACWCQATARKAEAGEVVG